MAELQTPVYIGIPEHVEIRRDLLLCSRDILFALKAYEAAREARARRIELIFDLHKVMDELGVLTKKIRLKMPRMPGKISLTQPMQLPEEKVRPTPGKKTPRKEKDKLDILDQEMTRIEGKLKRLT